MKKLIFISLIALSISTILFSQTKGKEINTKTTIKQKPIELNKAEFLSRVANYETNPNKWEYLGDKPAIIDFYANWCGPCRTLAPILDELAQEYGDRMYIYKVDTDAQPELTAAFGIRYLPTLIFIPMNGEPRVLSGGGKTKSELRKNINSMFFENSSDSK